MNPSNNPKSLKWKRVHFFPHVIVCPTLSVHDYSEKEIQACWYSHDDKKQIRREVNQAIEWMAGRRIQDRVSFLSKQDGYGTICTRGLEHQTKQGARLRRQVRMAAMMAVLDEQARQIKENVLDDETISMIYLKKVIGSKLQAYTIGLADSKACRQQEEMSMSCYYKQNEAFVLHRTGFSSDPCLMNRPTSLFSLRFIGHRTVMQSRSCAIR